MVKTIYDLFGVGPMVDIEVREEASAFIPEKDDAYTFRESLVRALMIWHTGIAGRNLLVHGPTGSGKSSLIEQFAARMGIPVHRMPCHSRSEFGEFTGQLTVKQDGSTEFVYGALPRAMREGGIMLFDEFNFMPPGVTGALNTVLDGGPLLLPQTGEIIKPHPNFRIAATGNGVDGGDDAASFRGIQRMNLALVQRFLTVKVEYLDPLEEARALHLNARDLPGCMIEDLISTANNVRSAFEQGDLETTMGTRVLVKMCRILNARLKFVEADPLSEAKSALGLVLTNGVNPTDAKAIEGTLARVGVRFGGNAVRKTRGSTPAASVSGARIFYMVNSNRQNSGSGAAWGYIHEVRGFSVFSAKLTPKVVLRWHGTTSGQDQIAAKANEKIQTRGYEDAGMFEIPEGMLHSEYLDEINAVFRLILIMAGAQGPVDVVQASAGSLSVQAQDVIARYAERKHGLTVSFR